MKTLPETGFSSDNVTATVVKPFVVKRRTYIVLERFQSNKGFDKNAGTALFLPVFRLHWLVDYPVAQVRSANFVLLNAVWHLYAHFENGRRPLLKPRCRIPRQVDNKRLRVMLFDVLDRDM